MQNFLQFLTEDKNTHLEHLEDDILNNGLSGGQNAIRFLESLLTMMHVIFFIIQILEVDTEL